MISSLLPEGCRQLLWFAFTRNIFFSRYTDKFFLFLSCCCNIPDIKFASVTVDKSISGSLPGRKHLFCIDNLFAKVQIFLELTHWLIGVLELRIYDGWITFLLAHRFFNARNSSGEIVKVQLLNLMKSNLNKTWKVMTGKTKERSALLWKGVREPLMEACTNLKSLKEICILSHAITVLYASVSSRAILCVRCFRKCWYWFPIPPLVL